MIVYNITLLTDAGVHENLKEWILNDFFPIVKEENLFKSHHLLKVIDSPNEGVTYAVQFQADERSKIDYFKNNSLNILHSKIAEDYNNAVFIFESLMEHQ